MKSFPVALPPVGNSELPQRSGSLTLDAVPEPEKVSALWASAGAPRLPSYGPPV